MIKKKLMFHIHWFTRVTLVLILLVAIITVKRTFSAINIIKNRLRNRIEDQ